MDERTDTVYIADGNGQVNVLDGAHCNAFVTSGCGQDLATIQLGGFLVDDAFNPTTKTLYVANPQGSVFVLNVAQCNRFTTVGCQQPVAAVPDANGPQAVAINVATNTIYATNNGTGNGNTVSVIDGYACNGTNTSGCATPLTVTVGSGAYWAAVDEANNTVYVANNDGTVSVINGALCDSTVTAGVRQPPAGGTDRGRARFRSRG